MLRSPMLNLESQHLLEKIFDENKVLFGKYQELKSLHENISSTPKVVVCGLLKAGKSSLLNALTNNFNTEYFETSSARATTKIKALEINGFIYIDTPGIDANKEDDEEAWRGLVDADLILFVHNLREGSLIESENQFLEVLNKKQHNLSHKLIIVFSNKDNILEQKQGQVSDSLYKEISGIINRVNDCKNYILVSSSEYKIGKLENEEELINISGILKLKELIQEKIDRKILTLERNKHVASLKESIQDEIYKMIDHRKQKVILLKQDREYEISLLRNDLLRMKETINERINYLESI